MASKPAPGGLGEKGTQLWDDITGLYDLRADELVVLEAACFEVDLIDRLELEFSVNALVVKGSMGQPVVAPLIPELRQHRATLATLLRQLKLPDENDTAENRSNQARAAALARWNKKTPRGA